MDTQDMKAVTAAPRLADKVAFLKSPRAYTPAPQEVNVRETHMSWVFLAGERVYKLKKPVRFAYLDFSTLRRREIACRAELHLNRRLAPEVYLDVQPLTMSGRGLSIAGDGAIVDWLVVMRRLDDAWMLDRVIREGRIRARDVDRLSRVLVRFYRNAERVLEAPEAYLRRWRESLALNARALSLPGFGLPPGMVRKVCRAQRAFLRARRSLFTAQLQSPGLVDGHGDLRPEHIWLGDPIRVIDCLEFNPMLRAVDPFDEIAYLGIECDILDAGWVGERLRRNMARSPRGGFSEELFAFYRCYRATLRARLAISHLHEAHPRESKKWAPLARRYLAIAAGDALRLEGFLKTPADR